MQAKQLVDKYGKHLIGCHVNTEAIGDYPGGVAKVIKLTPDPAAPEIVFQVIHPTYGEIGVFAREQCSLV